MEGCSPPSCWPPAASRRVGTAATVGGSRITTNTLDATYREAAAHDQRREPRAPAAEPGPDPAGSAAGSTARSPAARACHRAAGRHRRRSTSARSQAQRQPAPRDHVRPTARRPRSRRPTTPSASTTASRRRQGRRGRAVRRPGQGRRPRPTRCSAKLKADLGNAAAIAAAVLQHRAASAPSAAQLGAVSIGRAMRCPQPRRPRSTSRSSPTVADADYAVFMVDGPARPAPTCRRRSTKSPRSRSTRASVRGARSPTPTAPRPRVVTAASDVVAPVPERRGRSVRAPPRPRLPRPPLPRPAAPAPAASAPAVRAVRGAARPPPPLPRHAHRHPPRRPRPLPAPDR